MAKKRVVAKKKVVKKAAKPIIPKIPVKKTATRTHILKAPSKRRVTPIKPAKKKATLVKKIPTKKTVIKKHLPSHPIHLPVVHHRESGADKALTENFVALQKVMVNLSVKFDNLNNQISRLLNLFEISAKALAEKGVDTGNKEMIGKIDNLLEQNKLIARGLTLVHEGKGMQMPQKPSQPIPSMHSPTQPSMQRIPGAQQQQAPPKTQEMPVSLMPPQQPRAVEQKGGPQTSPQPKFKPLPRE